MDEILKKYGIPNNNEFYVIKEKLERIQREKLEALNEIKLNGRNNVEDIRKEKFLQEDLREIEDAIKSITLSISLLSVGLNRNKVNEDNSKVKANPDAEIDDFKDKTSETKIQVHKIVSEYEDLVKLAEQGDTDILCRLGRMHYTGEGALKSKAKSIYWHTKAAELGHVDSQYILGTMYELGDGVEANDEIALQWYEKASNQGNVDGLYKVGKYYLNTSNQRKLDYFLNPQYEEAIQKLLWAAKQGHQEAMTLLIEECYDKEKRSTVAENMSLFVNIANQGNSKVQYLIGQVYHYGTKPIDEDYEKACEWYRKAADQEEEKAFYYLGLINYSGNKDIKQAVNWLTQSSKKGNADACYCLGKIYYMGDGINKDIDKAASWFIKAEQYGKIDFDGYLCRIYYEKGEYSNAFQQCNALKKHGGSSLKLDSKFLKPSDKYDAVVDKLLGDMYYYGQGTKKDYLLAANCYNYASRKGNIEAALCLGEMYWSGIGVEQSLSSAYECYYEHWATTSAYRGVILERLGDMEFFGLGHKEDIDRALWCYSEAEKCGMSSANLKISFIEKTEKRNNANQLNEPEFEIVVKWLEFAARAGCGKANMMLGDLYRNPDKNPQRFMKENNETYKQKDQYIQNSYKRALLWYRKAAELGITDAWTCIGQMYEEGYGIEKSYKDALENYKKAADNNNAEAIYYLGKMYEEGMGVDKDINKAIELYLKSTELGSVSAQRRLGDLHFHGIGLTQSYNKAMEYYLKAADHGDTISKSSIGYMHLFGYGVKKDYNKAFQWYSQAAECGNGDAQYNLGSLYQNGQGVSKDLVKSIQWFMKAAYQKQPQALNELCDLLDKETSVVLNEMAQSNHSDLQYLIGLTYYNNSNANLKKAIEWYRIAGEAGSMEAKSKLASIYFHGEAEDQEYKETLKWNNEAAMVGDADAQYNLAMMYYEGQGVECDRFIAKKWFYEAAELGHTKAMIRLGDLYLIDRWFFMKEESALECYEKAANLGDAEARLKYLMMRDKGEYKSPFYWYKKQALKGNPTARKAFDYIYDYYKKMSYNIISKYEKSAASGSIDAQITLALVYLMGFHVNQDTDKAAKYFKDAATQGDIDAHIFLANMYEGIGLEADYNLAAKWYKMLIELGLSHHRKLAVCYDKAGNFNEAFRWFLTAAEKGDVSIKLAEYYHKGIGTKQDFIKACEIYQIIINEENDKNACRELGYMYYLGQGVEKNHKIAAELLERGGPYSDSEILYALGDIYSSGKVEDKDYRKASNYLRRAAKKGIKRAKLKILELKMLNLYVED